MERKIIKMGDSSLVVSLPKPWVEKAQISKGSIVEVEEIATGELIVKPKKTKIKKNEVDITDLRHLDKSITDSYINGAEIIRIIPREKSIDPELMSIIYNTVNNLGGLEITEASGKKVVIEYFGGTGMPLKKILSRFALIVTNHLKSLRTAYKENNAAELETIKKIQETDKLYYTLLRNLITASSSVRAASEMQLTSKDPVYYTLLVKNLWEMAKLAENMDFYQTKYNEKVSYFFDKALECHRASIEAWKTKNRKMALDTMEKIETLLKELNVMEREITNFERESPSTDKSISRVAKVKEIVIGPEQHSLKSLLENIKEIFEYINRNLNVATLISLE